VFPLSAVNLCEVSTKAPASRMDQSQNLGKRMNYTVVVLTALVDWRLVASSGWPRATLALLHREGPSSGASSDVAHGGWGSSGHCGLRMATVTYERLRPAPRALSDGSKEWY
jgi:hypothetical protein